MDTQDTTTVLVDALPEAERDELFPLQRAPAVVEALGGSRPHVSAPRRWARSGVRGAVLRTVTQGRALLTTRRWLLEFFAEVDRARREQRGQSAAARAAEPADTDDEDAATLAKHGLARPNHERP